MPIPSMPEPAISKQDTGTTTITSATSAEEDSLDLQTQSIEEADATSLVDDLTAEKEQPVEVASIQQPSETKEQAQSQIAAPVDTKQDEQQSSESSNPTINIPNQDIVENQTRVMPNNVTEEKSPVIEDELSKPIISNINIQEVVSKPVTIVSNHNNVSQKSEKRAVVKQGSDRLAIANNIKSLPDEGRNTVPKFALLTADDRVRNAIAFLNHGELDKAEKELEDALVIEPNNSSARKLMRQLHVLPGDFFPQEEFFEYVLGPNETLIDISEKFLDDPLAFYMLAKLNNIKDPVSLVPGKILKIPGNAEEFGDLVKSPQRQKKENLKKDENLIKLERAKVYIDEHRFREAIELLTQFSGNKQFAHQQEARMLLALSYEKRAAVLDNKGGALEAQKLLETAVKQLPNIKTLASQLETVKNKREANRLYHVGLDLNNMGDSYQALKTFAKVLQLNPDHSEAKKLIVDLKLTVVETSHKRAMVLYRRQKLDQAIEIWNDILEIDPQYELARQYRARALELKRKIEQL